MSMGTIYSTTVGRPKELNLHRRGSIFLKTSLPYIIQILGSSFDGNICEIGAGMGHKFQHLSDAFPYAKMTGIEPSVHMRDKALERGIKLEYGTLDTTGLPSASQDVICLFQMWHHIAPSQYRRCIDELKRIIRPDGKIILLDTFAPEGDHSSIKSTIFGVANRFYAVLSQYPVASLRTRFLHAVISICNSGKYPPENFGYFSPHISEIQRAFGEVGFLPSNHISYGISQMFVFGNKS